MARDNLFEIGQIVKPQGLKGRIKARSYIVSKDIIQHLKEVFIEKPAATAEPFRIKTMQLQGGMLYLELAGIEDRDAAARLVGCRIFIALDQLEKLPEDEYYWQDLIGLQVMTEAGQDLGRIESIFPTGSNDVYVCRGGEREILLPAIGEVIRKIDIATGVVVVRLMKGL
jgi:16S rRNA processing protein RimM